MYWHVFSTGILGHSEFYVTVGFLSRNFDFILIHFREKSVIGSLNIDFYLFIFLKDV